MGCRPSWLVFVEREKKLKILKNTLGGYYSNSSEVLFHCPKCEHHKQKLSVNLDKNVFKCWVCDWSGRDIYRIVRRYGSSADKSKWKSLFQEMDVRDFSEKMFGKPDPVPPQEIDLPQAFVSLVNKNLPSTAQKPLNYLQSRGIDKTDIVRWKLGYCSQGRYAGRVILPSFGLQGRPNYFVARSYDGDWKKYMNPPCSKSVIFNDLYLDFEEDMIIVEGVFDAIKAGENSVPLLGSTLVETHPLFEKIVENDTPIYLALDPDAEKKTSKLISLFLKYDIEVYSVDVSPYEDVGQMSKEEFLERKQRAVFLNSHNYLVSRIAGI